MKKFLLKGILKDKSRSLLPIIVVSLGVFLTVVIYCWLNGIIGESIVMNANFNTGHVKVITREQAKSPDQMALDLSLTGISELKTQLRKEFPDMDWVARIRFGALIDIPDANGETRAQGPIVGWALDLFKNNKEKNRFNLAPSIIQGRLPQKSTEALISDDLAKKFDVRPGDEFTIFGTTMDGGMAFKNFTISGTVKFGATVLDRGAILIDLADAQDAFQMDDAATEILGFQQEQTYNDRKANEMKNIFNKNNSKNEDNFAPKMLTLAEQPGMGQFLVYVDYIGSLMVFIFVMAMSIVLWNSGLLGGLRRYTEFGVRLALGEDKTHIYTSLIFEALAIGFIGSIIGTILGLSVAYYIQSVGLNLGGMMQGSTLMMPTVARTVVTPTAYYLGFIPGVFSMVTGNLLAGIGIYKRSTARLFNELEV